MIERSTAVTPGMGSRLPRTWALLKVLTPREFRVRYRESMLDLAWAIITPLVYLAVYGVILTQAFGATGSCAPYLSLAWTGLVVWTFFSGALAMATTSLILAAPLTSKIYFPRESIPLADVGVNGLDFAISFVTIFIVAGIQGITPTPTVLGAVPVLLMVVVWTCGISVFASALAVFIRDLTQAVQLFLRAGFFATPVMYDVEFLGSLKWLAVINPIAVGIEGLRRTLLCGLWPNWTLTAIHLGLGAAVLVGSLYYMRRIEQRLADVL
jgi:ABC-type polysaccharide/polyol phosphate export permease